MLPRGLRTTNTANGDNTTHQESDMLWRSNSKLTATSVHRARCRGKCVHHKIHQSIAKCDQRDPRHQTSTSHWGIVPHQRVRPCSSLSQPRARDCRPIHFPKETCAKHLLLELQTAIRSRGVAWNNNITILHTLRDKKGTRHNNSRNENTQRENTNRFP